MINKKYNKLWAILTIVLLAILFIIAVFLSLKMFFAKKIPCGIKTIALLVLFIGFFSDQIMFWARRNDFNNPLHYSVYITGPMMIFSLGLISKKAVVQYLHQRNGKIYNFL